MDGIDSTDKIAIIVDTCHKCADMLKDPTQGKDMSAEARKIARDDAYDELITCIDVLAACVEYHNGFFDVVSIANKYKVDVSTK
jgi:hypothetical protein